MAFVKLSYNILQETDLVVVNQSEHGRPCRSHFRRNPFYLRGEMDVK